MEVTVLPWPKDPTDIKCYEKCKKTFIEQHWI